ncbi:hypothetical protein AB4Z10_13295 [Bosea sp. RAF48]|uniref:hypothetical protein n=1 Tax=Bosea sp. RAF48 TaxID=3237480 RepID=UPI003F913B53
MGQSLRAAIARFPDRGQAIKELAARDEDFHTLCMDLRDAAAALARWELAVSPVREERCTGYRELATRLADEISTALDRHSH